MHVYGMHIHACLYDLRACECVCVGKYTTIMCACFCSSYAWCTAGLPGVDIQRC
jgi:hypothetical protein